MNSTKLILKNSKGVSKYPYIISKYNNQMKSYLLK